MLSPTLALRVHTVTVTSHIHTVTVTHIHTVTQLFTVNVSQHGITHRPAQAQLADGDGVSAALSSVAVHLRACREDGF